MFFRQYELGCLSLFSYMVGDERTGRVVVVDPQRDVSQYLADARDRGLRIERVIETHFHADFVSGHLELAAATGAAIAYGDVARAEFPIERLHEGQHLSLGDVRLEIRHTPGHTPESISIVIWEHVDDPAPWGVLTGDALFIGDVGRPDLLSAAGRSADDLARRLYRSVHEQLLTLPDATRVFPAHGAGSACGKHLSTAHESTIGEQRRTNHALAPMSEDDFVDLVTHGQPVAPLYFAFAADSNRRDRELLDDHRGPPRVDVERTLALQADGAVVIDGRAPATFVAGHIRGSVNVGLHGRFAEFAGDVVRPGQSVIVVTDPGREKEARIRLARIGFDRVVGALHDIDAVLAEFPELAGHASRISAAELAENRRADSTLQIVDVRSPNECVDAVDGAVNLPLPNLLDRIGELDRSRPTVVYCASGYRSATAASLLRSLGFARVADVEGGLGGACATPISPVAG